MVLPGIGAAGWLHKNVKFAALATLVLGLAACGLDAGNNDKPTEGITNPVVAATVNGRPIYIEDVRMRASEYCGLQDGQDVEGDPAIFNCALRALIEERLFAAEAERRGLDRDPEVRRQLELARERVLADSIYRDLYAAASDPERVETAYRNNQRDLGGRPEVTLSHILFESRGAALAAMRRLQSGERFEVLAMELSLDRATAPAGGFQGQQFIADLPPAFRDLATTLEVGTVGGPIQSDDGWHLIRVDARGESDGQSLDSARINIINVLLRQEVDDLYAKLADDAVIETVEQEDAGAGPTAETPVPAEAPPAAGSEPQRPAAIGAGALAAGSAPTPTAPTTAAPAPTPAPAVTNAPTVPAPPRTTPRPAARPTTPPTNPPSTAPAPTPASPSAAPTDRSPAAGPTP